MAISFYTPPEYGPVPVVQPQEQSNNNHQQDANNNDLVGVNNNHQGGNDNPINSNMGFVQRLATEVLGALQIRQQQQQQQRNNSSNHSDLSSAQDNSSSVPGASSSSSSSSLSAGDNQNARQHLNRLPLQSRRRHNAARQVHHLNASSPPDIIADHGGAPSPPLAVLDLLPPLTSLPDIVTCHAGLSLRYGSSHPNEQTNELSLSSANHDDLSSPLTLSSSEEQENHHNQGPSGPYPLSPRSSNHLPAGTMDFEVSLKLGMSCMANQHQQRPDLIVDDNEVNQLDVPRLPIAEEYRLAGRQLRHIADNFQLQRSQARRHENNQSHFELNVAITVAIPAVALIGFGLAYLRRT